MTMEIAMSALERRYWVPASCENYIQGIASSIASASTHDIDTKIDALIEDNAAIHDDISINLNPATNVMNPRAEAALARGLGSRPSLGYPGDKYEMGVEAIEQIEVIAAALAAEIFQAKFAEIRVGSGTLANLYAYMATTKPGDAIIVPPSTIGGHITHHKGGCAGLYGLDIHAAPIDADSYTVDVAGLRALASKVRPKLITIGGSLNLIEHPVSEIRAIADSVGAKVMFDAAHQCGLIAGAVWKNPLHLGAHIMTMSTYKSLAGPAGGLIVTNEAALARRLDAIAYPGMTANFDAGKSASLAITLLDWRDHGRAYATAMVDTAKALAHALAADGVAVFGDKLGFTTSHQFAIAAARYGGGQTVAKRLREANILTCGIGLPISAVDGDLNGLRIGTPEIVRRGMGPKDMPQLARLISRAMNANDAGALAEEVTAFRRLFAGLHFVRGSGAKLL
jgi:glycine hydroxymethyltransferase